MNPKALILFATGTNRDGDAADALRLAGADPHIAPLTELRRGAIDWKDYQILVAPGGFSYADALGAGKLLGLDLTHYFSDQVQAFVDAGKPVIGICNGFQALVRAGILPDRQAGDAKPAATLTFNAGNHFECRWVHLKPVSNLCVWTRGLGEIIDCPVAHGEGNFQLTDPAGVNTLLANGQAALLYARSDGQIAGGQYPFNPNGSIADIAGVCNPRGNVLGLMPHPEDHIFEFQSPDRFRRPGHSGRVLFENGVKAAQEL